MAAATNPSATPIKGLSTANQKETFHSGFSGFEFLFMLFSQAPEGRNFTKREICFVMLCGGKPMRIDAERRAGPRDWIRIKLSTGKA
jgi:hypothetical protein